MLEKEFHDVLCSFLHLSIKHQVLLNTYYESGSVLGTWHTTINNTQKCPSLYCSACTLDKHDNKQVGYWACYAMINAFWIKVELRIEIRAWRGWEIIQFYSEQSRETLLIRRKKEKWESHSNSENWSWNSCSFLRNLIMII